MPRHLLDAGRYRNGSSIFSARKFDRSRSGPGPSRRGQGTGVGSDVTVQAPRLQLRHQAERREAPGPAPGPALAAPDGLMAAAAVWAKPIPDPIPPAVTPWPAADGPAERLKDSLGRAAADAAAAPSPWTDAPPDPCLVKMAGGAARPKMRACSILAASSSAFLLRAAAASSACFR